MKRKQNILGIFAAVLVVGGIISGCNLHKKNGPAAPDYSKPNTSTATFTITATGVYSSTYTNTPTITLTPTITFTPTITNTHVNATDTVTNTSTVTSTATVTSTPTSTPTACTQGSLLPLYSFNGDLQCWKNHVGDNSLAGATAYVSSTSPYAGSGCYGSSVPFTAMSQHEQFEIDFASQAENLTGKALRCWVKVSSAVMGTGSCTVKLVVQSNNWFYEQSGDFTVSYANTWTQFTWQPTWVGGNAASVQRVGLQIYSGGSGTPTTGDVFFDEFEIFDVVPATNTPTPVPGAAQGWKFDSSLQSWGMDGSGTASAVTLGSIVAWDGTVDAENNPLSGSVSLYIPFTSTGQNFLLADSFPSPAPVIDLSGKSISVKVRVDSWPGVTLATNPGTAWIVLKSTNGSWIAAQGAAVNLTSTGNWITLTIPNASSPSQANPGYDPTKIIQAAVVIESPGSATGPAVFHVDDWLYQ